MVICWIYINEKEVGHHIKRIVITMSLVCMIPTFIGWGKEFVSFTPQLASDILGSNGNTMGLANNMFVENPNWSKCTEESDGLIYADKYDELGQPWGSRGKGFDHSRSDEGKWAVGVHVFTIFSKDLFLKTVDGVVNDLKAPGGGTYSLIPKKTDNG